MTQTGVAFFSQDVLRRTSEPRPGTQEAIILAALRAGDRITPKEALERFGTMRLGARIFDLKKMGHDIHCEMLKVGPRTRVARYSLQK